MNSKNKKPKDSGLFCDHCGHYPIKPEHAHFRCPKCGNRTSCCEGGAC